MAIYFDYTVEVKDDKAKLKEGDIYLYLGNKNIDFYFTVVEARLKFRDNSDPVNIVEKVGPSNAVVTLLKPDKTYVTGGMGTVYNGKIKWTVTEDMIDEINEVGDHTLVIDLVDADSNSVATLPPIEGQFHVKERVTPIPGEIGTTNAVNLAVVGLAATTTGDAVTIVDDDGNYVKTEWLDGDKITKEKLNKIEQGIYLNSSKAKNISDDTISTKTTWSSSKVKQELDNLNSTVASYDVASEKITINSNNSSYDEVNKRIVLS